MGKLPSEPAQTARGDGERVQWRRRAIAMLIGAAAAGLLFVVLRALWRSPGGDLAAILGAAALVLIPFIAVLTFVGLCGPSEPEMVQAQLVPYLWAVLPFSALCAVWVGFAATHPGLLMLAWVAVWAFIARFGIGARTCDLTRLGGSLLLLAASTVAGVLLQRFFASESS